jgi:hypothetical protein
VNSCTVFNIWTLKQRIQNEHINVEWRFWMCMCYVLSCVQYVQCVIHTCVIYVMRWYFSFQKIFTYRKKSNKKYAHLTMFSFVPGH